MRNNHARSFVTIMMAIALSAFVLRFAIERLIKLGIARNESEALGALKLISASLENYALDNRGAYPVSLIALTKTKPPYLEKEYVKPSLLKGYNFSCGRLEPSGYSCSAVPIACRLTGKTSYSVSTGNLLLSEECDKK
ncbi:MAG: hypothetical protein WC628_09530 [Candidatus Omnitrophota bacterium]